MLNFLFILEGVAISLLLIYLPSLRQAEQQDTSTKPSPPPLIPLSSYGEPCTCDRDCDLSRWLVCNSTSNKCHCLSKETFQYDFTRGICVVRLGKKCFEVDELKAYPVFISSYVRCVEGAFCSISAGGLCACNAFGYYESEDGEGCEAKKAFGEKCQHSWQCKTDACLGGECKCKEGQYYDSSREKCIALVGTFCFKDDECTDFAICGEHGKCECNTAFHATPEGRCAPKLKLGDACSKGKSCNNPALSCRNGVCSCRYPKNQDAECLSLVKSGPCTYNGGCTPSSNSCVNGECVCKEGYLEMEDGTCKKYGNIDTPCSKDEECDPLPPLVCKDFHCQCEDALTIYDSGRRMCRGAHGFRGCTGRDECIDNASCVQCNKKLPAKCLCETGFKFSRKNRTCIQYENPSGIITI